MQLKAAVKKLSQEKKISAQLVMQNYMLERFLERVPVPRPYFPPTLKRQISIW